jgi:lipoprotein-releasing system permease protein
MRLSEWKTAILCCAAAAACSTSSSPPPSPTSGARPGQTSATVETLSAREIRDRVVGANGHVVVLSSLAPFRDHRAVLAAVEETPGVVAAEPFALAEALAARGGTPVGVVVKGVDPGRVGHVLAVATQLTAGTLDDLAADPRGVIVGDLLAAALGVKPGDTISVTLPPPDPSRPGAAGAPPSPLPPGAGASAPLDAGADAAAPLAPPFVVRGVFHADFEEYDRRLAYANLAAVQALVGDAEAVTGIEARVEDVERADQVARAIAARLGDGPYRVMDWRELNRNLFEALRLQGETTSPR